MSLSDMHSQIGTSHYSKHCCAPFPLVLFRLPRQSKLLVEAQNIDLWALTFCHSPLLFALWLLHSRACLFLASPSIPLAL